MDKNSPPHLNVFLGACADKLSAQLLKIGARFDKETVQSFEKDLAAIVRLTVRGVLSEKERDTAYQRLIKQIRQHVQQHN